MKQNVRLRYAFAEYIAISVPKKNPGADEPFREI